MTSILKGRSVENGVEVELYDAFAAEMFGGNIAGVLLNAAGIGDATMQKIAAELGAPTTGFVVGSTAGQVPVFRVRYFTPTQEIDLCGHVTVAVFTSLARAGLIGASSKGTRVIQETYAGSLEVTIYRDEKGDILVEMTQRSPEFKTPSVTREAALRVLGGELGASTDLPFEIVATGLKHLFVPFSDVVDLGRLSPDFGEMRKLSQNLSVDTICTYALDSRTPNAVRTRDFCPSIGNNEEAASGTTSGALASLLWKFKHAGEAIEERYTLTQGVEMGRPSLIEAVLQIREGKIGRVSVSGRAIRVLHGALELS